jgi:hypothetical protein
VWFSVLVLNIIGLEKGERNAYLLGCTLRVFLCSPLLAHRLIKPAVILKLFCTASGEKRSPENQW